jgi:hypothetical protein
MPYMGKYAYSLTQCHFYATVVNFNWVYHRRLIDSSNSFQLLSKSHQLAVQSKDIYALTRGLRR